MNGRKRSPKVAKAGPRRRLIEFGKDVLIVALACSAVFLASMTPMMTQLRRWMAPAAQLPASQPRQAGESVTPYGVAVRNSRGLYGVSYDQTLTGRAFDQISPLLGEALTTAGTAEPITDRQWRRLLERPGVYCVFQGSPPLSVLSAWLGKGEVPEWKGGAQTLTLGWDGAAIWLGWQEGDSFYRARTQVAYEGHMEAVLEEFNPNGAAFAYSLSEGDGVYDTLDPYVLVVRTALRPPSYTSVSPDFMGDNEALGTLLQTLGFRSGAGSAYEAAGELAINESGDRLRVDAAGRVVFHAGEEERYPVSAAGEAPTAQEAALAAWDVLNRAVEPWKGETAYILTEVEETGTGWTVTFHSRLGGIPLRVGQEGWCAQFTIEGKRVSDFAIFLRSYTPTGNATPVTSERLAAAALRSQDGSGGKLTLYYNDNRSDPVTAVWISEE